MLSKDDDVTLTGIFICVHLDLSGLFTDIGHPCSFHLRLSFVCCLLVPLSIKVIVCENFHRLIAIALDLQVRVCNHDAIGVERISHRAWDQIVRELNFEQDISIVHKVKSAIN